MTAVTSARFPVVALVSFTGGLEALSVMLSGLPADFPAAVIAMQHISPDRVSLLASILDRRTALPVADASDGDLLVPGRVLVTPSGRHLLVGPDERVRLINTGALPPARPSADLLLSTLAVALGPRVLAVVLTGAGSDGSLGAQAVHTFGGRTLVQDEATAALYGMPAATVAADHPATPLRLQEIAQQLVAMTSG